MDKGPGHTCRRRGEAPESHARCKQTRTRPAVAKPAEQRRRHEKRHEERVRQQTQLRVGEIEVGLDARQHGREDEPIDVVDEVEERDEREPVVRGRGRQTARSS